MTFTLLEAARLAQFVYEAEIEPGVSTSGPPPVEGWGPQVWRHECGSGFTGAIYSSGGRDQIVLAFAGTNISSIQDLKADAYIALNEVPIDQMERANRMYIAAKDVSGDREIIVTGHSLGGGLAQFIAAAYGVRCVTFNAPAMGAHMQSWSSKTGQPKVNEAQLRNSIVNFRSIFDPVSIGMQLLDGVRLAVPWALGTSLFGFIPARHLGRVVSLGPGAGLHAMGSLVKYIAARDIGSRSPWSVGG